MKGSHDCTLRREKRKSRLQSRFDPTERSRTPRSVINALGVFLFQLEIVLRMSTKEGILEQWSLKGQSYVVTGGAKGIGFAAVQALLAHQASMVIFCSRSPCEDVVASLQSEYPEATIRHVFCDVSTKEGRSILVEFIKSNLHGKSLSGLINNVGVNIRKPILEQTEQEYASIMQTNVDSAYFLSKSCFELLTKGSTIVNVSSAAGVQSSGTGIAYGISKAAVNHLTRTLACEWAAKGIRVNAVTPWMTMTPMLQEAVQKNPSQLDKVSAWTPMHRLADASEIAGPIVFLCMPCSSYITGQVLGVDGGLTAQGFDGPCVTP